ncbi:MAG: hypothetical protein AAGE52_23715 [Myxococcota bacterium]
MYQPFARIRRVLAAMLVLTGLTGAVVWDAIRRQTAVDQNVVRTLGWADLALSSGARWLRHPSQVEAEAPFSDLPAALDVDPAGALIGPPEPR